MNRIGAVPTISSCTPKLLHLRVGVEVDIGLDLQYYDKSSSKDIVPYEVVANGLPEGLQLIQDPLSLVGTPEGELEGSMIIQLFTRSIEPMKGKHGQVMMFALYSDGELVTCEKYHESSPVIISLSFSPTLPTVTLSEITGRVGEKIHLPLFAQAQDSTDINSATIESTSYEVSSPSLNSLGLHVENGFVTGTLQKAFSSQIKLNVFLRSDFSYCQEYDVNVNISDVSQLFLHYPASYKGKESPESNIITGEVGEEVAEYQLRVVGSHDDCKFVYAGRIPDGLELTQSGCICGVPTVETNEDNDFIVVHAENKLTVSDPLEISFQIVHSSREADTDIIEVGE